MNYCEEHGDITKMPQEYVIAHCISCDCAMGAGVVVPLKKKFKELKPECQSFIRCIGGIKNGVGKAYRYKDENGVCYNMFTKTTVWKHAGVGMSNMEYLENIEKCLNSVKSQMLNNEETKIVMPLIGCGLDNCVWSQVSSIVKEVFKDTEFEVHICIL